MWTVILAGVVMIGLITPGQAEFMTGNRLQALCKASKGFALVESAFLLGYVTATSDDLRAIDTTVTKVCIPAAATYGQIQDVVCRYVERHPERRHIQVTTMSREAMADAWPVRSRNRG